MTMSEAQSVENSIVKVTIKTAFAIVLTVAGCGWVCASYLSTINEKLTALNFKQDKVILEMTYKIQETNARIDIIDGKVNYNSSDVTKMDVRLTNIERKLN